ncbi:MAG: hypothetical protein M1812_000720 [Candelaria pacifica]|nr:MAG: hypothetical protein M1812_000720 [Candelaria pacifica]
MIPISSLLNEEEYSPAVASAPSLQNMAQQALTNSEGESPVNTQNDVEVTSGSPQRSVELQSDTRAGDPSQYEEEDADREGEDTSAPRTEVALKKKKRSKGGKGKNKPTGFEEYYVDAPITPEESKEEEDLYSPSRTFVERIETCIQRYKARRKFDSERKDIFDKWMSYGGIITGPKAFGGGLDANTLDSKDAEEIATLTATDYVGGDKYRVGQEGSAFVVDFEAVVKAFLASRVPLNFDFHTLKMNQACVAIIRNFLNYLIYHNVCPEFNDQIYAARHICERADKELFATKEASSRLPGPFNAACSTLFGGYYKNLYSGDQDWAEELGEIAGSIGMSNRLASKIAQAGFGAYGTREICEAANQGKLRVIKSTRLGFEISELIYADDETRQYYQEHVPTQMSGTFQVLGKIKAKPWVNPDEPEDDRSDSGGEEGEITQLDREFELWIEEDLLDLCFVGMKIEAEVKQFNCGVLYFDSVSAVRPSFFESIPNEMLIGWVEPTEMKQSEAERIEQANEPAMEVEDD